MRDAFDNIVDSLEDLNAAGDQIIDEFADKPAGAEFLQDTSKQARDLGGLACTYKDGTDEYDDIITGKDGDPYVGSDVRLGLEGADAESLM